MPFDTKDYIQKQNEKEAADRNGKPAQVQATVVPEKKPEEDKGAETQPGVPRAIRRELNRFREEAAEARGEAKALREMLKQADKSPVTVTAENALHDDPEPQRKDFSDDAQYNRALGRWDARQEAKKLVGETAKTAEQEKANEQWQAHVKEMDTKAQEDKKLIPDYDKVAEEAVEAAEEDETLRFVPSEQPTFFALLMQSDVRAFVYHHFAKNPDELRKMLAARPEEQIRLFSRLEGRVEKMYSTEKPKDVSDKKTETAAERDAKKPKPSESGAPKGGSAPVTTVSPYLPDGKTLNPAWKAQQNEREGLRR